jgi:predicted alpha/beta superfamily hydrolase
MFKKIKTNKKSKLINVIVSSMLILAFIQLNAQNSKNVNIPGTQVQKIFSEINKQEYILHINLPRFYDDTTKDYPVVYLLDSQWDFPLVSAIYGEQYYDGFLPDLIIVGITWGGKNPNADILRARDFTPTDIHQNNPTGNAEKFLEFISRELIPFIENNYRGSKTDRTLMGSSLGGLFTLYTLFTQYEIFNKYVLTSPALTWDNGVLSKYEEKYFIHSDQLPVRLAMCVGELEGLYPPFQDFVKKLKERNYNNLELFTKVIEGIGHSGSKADGYTRGLQFVFSLPAIAVDPSILQSYVGEYEVNSEMKINLKIENGQLVIELPFNSIIKLFAETNLKFYAKGEFAKVDFIKDDLNNVTGFNLEQYNGKSFIKKLK